MGGEVSKKAGEDARAPTFFSFGLSNLQTQRARWAPDAVQNFPKFLSLRNLHAIQALDPTEQGSASLLSALLAALISAL
jgi:hypothetical protein